MDKIQRLWDEHLAAPFPTELRGGKQINGHYAIMLDADIAGCISTFLKRDRKLDKRRIKVLQVCQEILKNTLDTLDGYPQEYFKRLKLLAELVLAELNIHPIHKWQSRRLS